MRVLKILYIDTETVGLHGVAVLFQHAVNDGEIKLWDVWREPISETLELIEWYMDEQSVFFNAAFDMFHIAKIYTTFDLFPDHSVIPEDHINELAILEEQARLSPLCIKPRSTLDLMLHSRKGKYQNLMSRKDIKVRRVPTRLAEQLRCELEKRVELDGVYFSGKKNKNAPQWQITDAHDKNGDIDPNFKNIVLRFKSSGALKVLAQHALGVEEDLILKFTDIEPDKFWRPKEYGYAPYALAVGKPGKWNWAWPEVIKHHITHWSFNRLARKYAGNDVDYTRQLYHYFDEPEFDDVDSTLAAMVAVCRWRGYKINIPELKKQRSLAIVAKKDTPISPNGVKGYLGEVMDSLEKITLKEGTGKEVLESIEKWDNEGEKHPAAIRATAVLDARHAKKEIENFDKLILAGRFHASLKVIGTKSSRMSGADDLNPQGIKNSDGVRGCFPLAEDDFILSGGDFASFEICISEAVYKDERLHKDLTKKIECTHCNKDEDCPFCGGKGWYIKKIHTLFAMELFPGATYEEIILGGKKTNSKYDKGKRGVYGMIYGGDWSTLVNRLGVDEETAVKAYDGFGKTYPGIEKARERIKTKFCSMTQPGGIGTEVVWKDPEECIESLLGFPRYFTIENKIVKELFDLAQNPPARWKKVKIKFLRRDRLQTASGATQSALFAAAFGIQAMNMRAAANHEIQSTGGEITKKLQRNLWNLQPYGVAPWVIQPLNIHDEIMAPCLPEVVDAVSTIVDETVESYRGVIPLIKIDWSQRLKTWADK